MATAFDILKQVPQGIPTQLLTTGANETASVAISVFGQSVSVKMDAKITDSSATIPSSLTTATNFTKTAHPGGALDLTTTHFYAEETLNSVATRHIIYPGSMTYRNRNVNETFDSAATLPALQGHVRDADVARSLVLSDYFGSTTTLSLYSGQPSRLTPLASLSLLGTKSGFNNRGNGAYVASSTGFSITMGSNGTTSHTTNFTSGTVYNANNNGADLYTFVLNTETGGSYTPHQTRMIGFGSYIFAFCLRNDATSTLRAYSAPMSGFLNNNTTNPGWGSRQTASTGTAYTTTDYLGGGNNFASQIAELGGTAFFLIAPNSSPSNTNHALCKAVMNGSTGAVTGLAQVVSSNVDGTFAPIKIGGKLTYRYANGTFFQVDSAGTVTAYTASLSRPFNMKTLATNYATTIQYKNSDGALDTDGLAYFQSGTAYTTNGTEFCTKDGKYTLVSDSSLNQLVLFDSNDNWFEKQLGLGVGDRVDYTQVTLGPSSSLWLTANGTVQVNVFGFRG